MEVRFITVKADDTFFLQLLSSSCFNLTFVSSIYLYTGK